MPCRQIDNFYRKEREKKIELVSRPEGPDDLAEQVCHGVCQAEADESHHKTPSSHPEKAQFDSFLILKHEFKFKMKQGTSKSK